MCAPPPVAMILTLFFITSSGTRFDAAELSMRVERKVMHDERSVVSNLTKLSRPPDGMLDVDERRAERFWNGG